jgi:hypothetical protein
MYYKPRENFVNHPVYVYKYFANLREGSMTARRFRGNNLYAKASKNSKSVSIQFGGINSILELLRRVDVCGVTDVSEVTDILNFRDWYVQFRWLYACTKLICFKKSTGWEDWYLCSPPSLWLFRNISTHTQKHARLQTWNLKKEIVHISRMSVTMLTFTLRNCSGLGS